MGMFHFLVIVLLGVTSLTAFLLWSDAVVPTNPSAGEITDTESSELVNQPEVVGVPLFSGKSIEVYSGISFPERSTVIDVSGRGLTGSLKAEVRLLPELTTLDLSDNAFTGLPAEVGQLRQLRVLDLSNNQFTGLPHELANLQQLERLDLRGNAISEFDLATIRRGLPATVQIVE